MCFQEREGAGNDLARARIGIQDIKAVTAVRVVHRFDSRATPECLLNEGVNAGIDIGVIKSGASDV